MLIAVGSVAGALLVAALSPAGPRLGVPSVIAARAALGLRGAALVAVLLYVTNFAWVAVNYVIAASACARLAGGPASERFWAAAPGLVATAIVAGGPRAVALADRHAVPLLAVVGVLLTIACVRWVLTSGFPRLDRRQRRLLPRSLDRRHAPLSRGRYRRLLGRRQVPRARWRWRRNS